MALSDSDQENGISLWTDVLRAQAKRTRVVGQSTAQSRLSQLAEALAAGAFLAGELDVDEDESEELDDSFVELDDESLFDESLFDEFDEEETVLELLSRESVA